VRYKVSGGYCDVSIDDDGTMTCVYETLRWVEEFGVTVYEDKPDADMSVTPGEILG